MNKGIYKTKHGYTCHAWDTLKLSVKNYGEESRYHDLVSAYMKKHADLKMLKEYFEVPSKGL